METISTSATLISGRGVSSPKNRTVEPLTAERIASTRARGMFTSSGRYAKPALRMARNVRMNGDEGLRGESSSTEPAGKSVGLLVQLGVHKTGVPGIVRLLDVVQAHPVNLCHGRRVSQGQCRNTRIRVVEAAAQDFEEDVDDTADGGLLEQVRRKRDVAPEPVLFPVQMELQVEARRRHGGQRLALDILQPDAAEVLLGMQRKDELGERIPRGIAGPGQQRRDDALERHVLVLPGRRRRRPHLLHQPAERLVRLDDRPEALRVDEEPEKALDLGAASAGHGCRDRRVLGAREPKMRRAEGREENGERGHLLVAAEGLQTGEKTAGHFKVDLPGVSGEHRGPRLIAQELGRGVVFELGRPVIQLPLVLGHLRLLLLPEGEVAILDGQGGQLSQGVLAAAGGGIEDAEFLTHEIDGPAVRDDVVEDDGEDVVLVSKSEQGNAPAGLGGQVEGRRLFLAENLLMALGDGGYVNDAELPDVALVHDLHAHAVVLLKGGPERLVALLQRVQGGRESLDLEGAAETLRKGDEVPRRALVELVQEPEAALGVRELDGPRVRRCRDDGPVPGRVLADRREQVLQRRVLEDIGDGQLDADGPGHVDELDGHDGVAAEFEEVGPLAVGGGRELQAAEPHLPQPILGGLWLNVIDRRGGGGTVRMRGDGALDEVLDELGGDGTETLPIRLARDDGRTLPHADEIRGDGVVRQGLLQRRPQTLRSATVQDEGLLSVVFGLVRLKGTEEERDEGRAARLAGPLHGLGHGRQMTREHLAQMALDVPELHALAADLDLRVPAAEVCDGAVRPVADEVSGPVKPVSVGALRLTPFDRVPRRRGVEEWRLLRRRRDDVAPGDAGALDEQLADGADRGEPARVIRVRDPVPGTQGAADVLQVGGVGVHARGAGHGRALALAALMTRMRPAKASRWYAEKDSPPESSVLSPERLSGGMVATKDGVRVDQLTRARRMKPATSFMRSWSEGMQTQPPCMRVHMVSARLEPKAYEENCSERVSLSMPRPGLNSRAQEAKARCSSMAPLGSPVLPEVKMMGCCRRRGERFKQGVLEHDGAGNEAGEGAGVEPGREGKSGRGLSAYLGDTGGRVRRVDEGEGVAGLEHGEHAGDHPLGLLEAEGHSVAGVQLQGLDVGREARRDAVQLGVRPLAVPGVHGRAVRASAARRATTSWRQTSWRTSGAAFHPWISVRSSAVRMSSSPRVVNVGSGLEQLDQEAELAQETAGLAGVENALVVPGENRRRALGQAAGVVVGGGVGGGDVAGGGDGQHGLELTRGGAKVSGVADAVQVQAGMLEPADGGVVKGDGPEERGNTLVRVAKDTGRQHVLGRTGRTFDRNAEQDLRCMGVAGEKHGEGGPAHGGDGVLVLLNRRRRREIDAIFGFGGGMRSL
ncbi:hypothetical protein ColKHC_04960 [Colletotrichum higginsianum]|nr:hypothetical protein ColKHC_04960 [Colletotrichum higginsianum]